MEPKQKRQELSNWGRNCAQTCRQLKEVNFPKGKSLSRILQDLGFFMFLFHMGRTALNVDHHIFRKQEADNTVNMANILHRNVTYIKQKSEEEIYNVALSFKQITCML